MRRRTPPEVDPDRLRTLLASARPRPEPAGPSGWVPEEAPPEADTSWLDERPGADEGAALAEGPVVGEGAEAQPVGGRHRPPPRILSVPVAFRGARVAVSVRAVVAFVLVLVVAIVFFAVRVARAQQVATPQSVAAGEGLVGRGSMSTAFSSSGTSGASGSGGSASGGTGSATAGGAVEGASVSGGASARGSPGRLTVDVVGQVARPGVVTLPEGSRVVDVLAAAGGALPGADVQRLNLARLVADGEQVFVPRPGETPPVLVGAVGGSGTGSGAGGVGGVGSVGGTAASVLVDLNTATLAALDTLPGVGPVLAQRILDWRAQHGRFSSVDELGEVSGIGDKLLEQIRPKVRV